MECLLYSKKDAGKILGISVRTLENRIALGELRVRRIGRRVLLARTELEKFARRDPPVKPFDPHAWRGEAGTKDDQTKPKRKGNDNASESPRIQPQS